MAKQQTKKVADKKAAAPKKTAAKKAVAKVETLAVEAETSKPKLNKIQQAIEDFRNKNKKV